LNNTKPSVTCALGVLLLLGGITLTTFAQKITSFNATAKGQGTLTVSDAEQKIYAVAVNLKENGDADITLFTQMQLMARARWSEAKDLSQGIDLKITGGVVKGNATGTGKLFLSQDGKAITKLTIDAKSSHGSKVSVQFVAAEDNKAPSAKQPEIDAY